MLLILGLMSRTASVMLIMIIVTAVYLLHTGDLFSIGAHGEYALELHVFYVVVAAVVGLIGPGRFAVPSPRWMKPL